MVQKRYLVLFLLCIIYILSFFHRLCPTVIATDLTLDLGLSVTDLTLISSTTMFTYGLMQLPSGLLSDAIGAKKTIIAMTIATGICAILFSFASTPMVAILSRFFIGFGLAITVPSMTLLAVWFSKESFARANSLFLCCAGFGSILAAPPLLYLSQIIGWRWSIAFFGIITILTSILILFLIPDVHKKNKTSIDIKNILSGIKTVLTTKAFWPMALWQMFIFSAYFSLSSLWWGPYFIEGNGFSKVQTSMLITIGSIVLMFAQPLIGTLSDMYFKARKKPIIFLSILGLVASSIWIYFTGDLSFTLMSIQIACFCVGVASGAPLSFTMAKELFPPHLTGTAIGCLNMFYPMWMTITQMLYGSVLEWQYSLGASQEQAFSVASYVIVAHIGAAVICTFFMKETYKL